ncbi:MAG: hypothetical protein HN855_16190 [Anaerolineae bacterium]|jgi:hypothetical protein|nr:hypothetical protein [Anaerolineae bacterium]MBT7069817.1 hypothetical protein [Anaerolineae bacterium]MBT7326690.1 hypothetical protein [Anaerolineae bacterium]
MQLMSFDLEISKILPEFSGNLFNHAPLGISCAAVAHDQVRFWQGVPHLSKEESQTLVKDLMAFAADGNTFVTWNGCGFDFRLLAQESGMFEECGEMALNHVDLMLLVTFAKGWFLGLDKALQGANIAGKVHEVELANGEILSEMNGGLAPELWAKGEHNAVLTYLRGDVEQTLALAKVIQETKSIHWTSGRGKPQSVSVPRLMTVRECFDIREPDVSWMDNPPMREDFVKWIPDWEKKAKGWLF